MNSLTNESPDQDNERKVQIISLDPLFMFDHKGIIIDVNEAAVKSTGKSREELVGSHFSEYFIDPEKACKGVMQVFRTGEVIDYELEMKTKDDIRLIVSFNASVYRDEHGKVIGAYADARDITQLKQEEEQLKRLTAIIETTTDFVATGNQEGKVFYINSAGRKMLGIGEDEDISDLQVSDTHPDWASDIVMEQGIPAAIREGVWIGETAFLSRSGREIPVSQVIIAHRALDGSLEYLSTIARDISEIKKKETEIQNLQHYNRELIETSLDPLVTFDKKGIILDVNQSTVNATGKSREELIGTLFADYFTDPEKAKYGVMQVFKLGEVRDYELIMKNVDGTQTTVSLNASVYKDENENIVGAFAAARDITQRKLNEQRIQNLQRYNRELIETNLDPLVTFDMNGLILDVNEATIQVTGRSREELIGTPLADYFTDPEKADKVLMQVFEMGLARDYEMIMKARDVLEDIAGTPFADHLLDTEKPYKGVMLVFEGGDVRDYELVMKSRYETETIVSFNASVFRDETGNLVGAFASIHDITERKRARRQVENLQRYNRGLIEASLDPLVTFDQKGMIMDVNEATIKATGMTREELVGTPFADYFTDPDRAYKGAMLVFEIGEVRDYELVMKTRNGKELMVSYNATVYEDQTGKVVGAFAAARDITEHKRIEKEIEYLKNYNRGLIEASLDPLVTFDQHGIIMDVNQATVKATGRSRDDLVGTPFSSYFTDPEKAYRGVKLVFETGKVRDYELVLKARDGTKTSVSYNATVYKDQTGKVVGAFAAARDITEHKRTELKIQNLQRYYRGLIEASLDPLVTFDQQGTIQDVNDATIKATGLNREELIGTPFADYFTDPLKARRIVELVFETGKVQNYELVIKAVDGTLTCVSYNATVYKDLTGKVLGAFAAARDITLYKKEHRELQETIKRLEACMLEE